MIDQDAAAQSEDYYAPDHEPVKTEEDQNTDSAVSKTISEYNYSWSDSDDIPPVLIIIDDFGYIKGELLEEFAALPREIAFAVLPDLPNTELAGKKALATGHDVLIHIPMQAVGNSGSPGERHIKAGMAQDKINEYIDSFHDQLPMAIAANNHMGSLVTADADLMEHVLNALRKNKLGFVDSFTSAKSVAASMARAKDMKNARRDIFLDVPDNSESTLISKIESLGKYKGRREPIVIISHCHNRDKLIALQSFIAQIKAMGIKLISFSDLRDSYPS